MQVWGRAHPDVVRADTLSLRSDNVSARSDILTLIRDNVSHISDFLSVRRDIQTSICDNLSVRTTLVSIRTTSETLRRMLVRGIRNLSIASKGLGKGYYPCR